MNTDNKKTKLKSLKKYERVIVSFVLTIGLTVVFFAFGMNSDVAGGVIVKETGSIFSDSNIWFVLSGIVLILGTAISFLLLRKDKK